MKIGNKEFAGIMAAVVLLFFYYLFGFTGVKVIIGAFLVFFLPFYLILDNFKLDLSEKIIFSFFLGIGIFSAIAYYAALLFNSVRIGIMVTFLLLVGIGLFLRFRKKS